MYQLQRIGERMLSPDGKYIAFTVVPQEGDGRLYIRATSGSYAKEIPRGSNVAFTADGRWAAGGAPRGPGKLDSLTRIRQGLETQ